ncbi:hypothetical protein ZHAS_00011980 [Anopheles sinensis]|uniref:Uncharacterized protein n=1 Tax=Anopheles sinensis TaxID=74873 RepID=A0A084W1P9_ANOSI|nr:hypothetical protein ZHAS_00011980 [Anopheles sinensis]
MLSKPLKPHHRLPGVPAFPVKPLPTKLQPTGGTIVRLRPTRKFNNPKLYDDPSDPKLKDKQEKIALVAELNKVRYEPINLEKERLKLLEEAKQKEEA